MTDQLINLVRQAAGNEVVNNPAVPNEQNDNVIRTIGEDISGGLKEQAEKGDVQSLMNMFEKDDTSPDNPAVSGIIGKVVNSLSSKFGIAPDNAQQMVSGILPRVMGQFVNKAKDPNDKDFDLQDIIKNIGGGKAGELLGKLTGGTGGTGALGKIFG